MIDKRSRRMQIARKRAGMGDAVPSEEEEEEETRQRAISESLSGASRMMNKGGYQVAAGRRSGNRQSKVIDHWDW